MRAYLHVSEGPQVGERPQLGEVPHPTVVVYIYTQGGAWEIESTKKRKQVSVVRLPDLMS